MRTGTPFLCYFAEHVHLATSTAWTFSAFVAANVASAALVSSNPTNILIANVCTLFPCDQLGGAIADRVLNHARHQAFELNFITGYTAYTILPCVVTALVAFPIAFAVFTIAGPKSPAPADATAQPDSPAQPSQRSSSSSLALIPKQLTMPNVNPRDALLDPRGAIFHSSLMLVTLVVLIGTTFVPNEAVGVWMVTAPAGVVAFGYDLAAEWHRGRKARLASSDPNSDKKDTPSSDLKAEPMVPQPFVVERASLPGLVRAVRATFPTTSTTVSHLPVRTTSCCIANRVRVMLHC